MSDIESLRAFAAAATHGSFAAGGRALGVSRDRVSKLIYALEQQVGKPLFQRSTREVTLTQAGANYLERVRRALAELDAADRAVRDLDTRPFGTLRVHAPVSWGVVVLAPLCTEFRRAVPDVEVELSLDDAIVDPSPSAIDVVIRIADQLAESGLLQRIGPVSRALYAAPTYLSRRGAPETPDALREHDCVHYSNLQTGIHWVLERGEEVRRVPISGGFACNVGLGVLEAVRAGVGVGILPDFLAAAPLAANQLVRVLPDWRLPRRSILAFTPPAMRDAPKVRAYIAFIRSKLDSNRPIEGVIDRGQVSNPIV